MTGCDTEGSLSVTLINAFEVPMGREEEFLSGWRAVADHLAGEPGYRRTQLHRNIGPHAEYAFVNIAEWDSAEQFRAATQSKRFRQLATALSDFQAHPGLYETIYDHAV